MKKNKTIPLSLITAFLILIVCSSPAKAMHIMEGFLPIKWAIFWGVVTLPFLITGMNSIQKRLNENPKLKMILALSGAFVFILSALKLPSVTGSCSHPTGVGLGAILFGPGAMTVIGTIVLLFQTLLLAHGGVTTLGANVFSMAVIGPFVAYGTYKLLDKMKAPTSLSIFLAAMLGNLLTYVTTAGQLALAFPQDVGGISASMAKFSGIFALTQIPLAISEGILTVLVFNFLFSYNLEELKELKIFKNKNDLISTSENFTPQES